MLQQRSIKLFIAIAFFTGGAIILFLLPVKSQYFREENTKINPNILQVIVLIASVTKYSLLADICKKTKE